MGWFGGNRQTQEQKQVQSWIEWSYGLLKVRMEVLSSNATIADKDCKLQELTKQRLLESPRYTKPIDGNSVEWLFSEADSLECFSFFLISHVRSSHAKELGLVLLEMTKVKSPWDSQLIQRFNETMDIMAKEELEWMTQCKRRAELKIRAYLEAKGLPDTAPIPKDISLQAMEESLGNQEPVDDSVLKEIQAIYQHVSEVVMARRTEAVRMMTKIAIKYEINPNV